MDRGAWWAIVNGVTKSQAWLSTHTHTYNEALSSLKKEGNSGICYSMDVSWRYYAKRNKSISHKKTNTIWFHLYVTLRIVKIKTKSGMCFSGSKMGGGQWAVCWVGGYQFYRMKRVLEMDSGDAYTLQMCLISLDYTF